jgi:hypothetical protein
MSKFLTGRLDIDLGRIRLDCSLFYEVQNRTAKGTYVHPTGNGNLPGFNTTRELGLQTLRMRDAFTIPERRTKARKIVTFNFKLRKHCK